jgi:hypothetical protein
MPIQYINTGTAPNQGNGDTLRTAFTKINNNFDVLFNNLAVSDTVGEVITHPELQRGIAVTYNSSTQQASFLVNIASTSTLGGVKIGSGITVDPVTGVISAAGSSFNGNYNNLSNIPQALGINDSPSFAQLTSTGTIYQGTAYDGVDFSDTSIRVDADVDSFAQMIMKNHNSGTSASTDLVIMNNQGTDTENFIDLGINSSNYTVQQYSSTQPNDGYLFVNGGNLVIGTQTPNKKIVFHAGGTANSDSTAFFDEYAWQFNRQVTIDVDRPVPLNFTVINRSSNVVAQSLFQAQNNLGNLVHFGINSSHPEAFYGRIGPNEAFLHLENSTSSLHLGSYGDLVFYSDLANGFEGTPTLVMSSIDQSSAFNGHVLPTTDLTYDLGSADKQWRSLYVGTSTIFIGGVPITVNTATNTLQVGAVNTTSVTTVATFNVNGNLILPAGGDILDSNGNSVLGGATGDQNVWVQTFETVDGAPADVVAAALSVEYDSEGNLICLFSHSEDFNFMGGPAGGSYFSVAKIATTGTILWQARFGAGFYTDGWGLAVDNDAGFIYIAGTVNVNDEVGETKSMLTKLSLVDGEPVWSKVYDFGFNSDSPVVDVATGDPVMVGYADADESENYVTVTKIDSTDGSVFWSRKLDGQGYEYAYGMGVGPSGEVVAVGYVDQLITVLESYPVTPQAGSGMEVLVINRSELSTATFTNSWKVAGTGISEYADVSFINTYAGLTSTVREGSGATFDITADGSGSYTVDVVDGGTNYLPGHKIKILGSALGGEDVTNDLIIEVNATSEGSILTVTPTGASVGLAVYTSVSGTNYQTGSGLVFNLALDSGSTYTEHPASFQNAGANYVTGDVITVSGTQLGGASPANDLTATVSVTDGGAVTQFNTFSGTQQTSTYRILVSESEVDFGGTGTWTLNDVTVDQADHMLVVKYNSSGAIQWQKAIQFDDGYDCQGADCDIDSDGNIYVTGQYDKTDDIGVALSIIKFNSSGVAQWSRRVTGNCETFGTSIVVGGDNNLYLSGMTSIQNPDFPDSGSPYSDSHLVLAKYSPAGAVLWQRLLENSTTWSFSGSLFGPIGGSNLAVKDGYVALSGAYGSFDDSIVSASVAQVSTEGTVFSVGNWDFVAANFSGTLFDDASDLTVVDADKTDSDLSGDITTTDSALEADASNFLIGTIYRENGGGDRLVNSGNELVLGDTGTVTLPFGGTISEGVVTSNPTIQLTPANPDVASQKLVIKGGGGQYYNLENGIDLGTNNNVWAVSDSATFYVYAPTRPNETLYWWIVPEEGGISTTMSGTVELGSEGGGVFNFTVISDAYEFRVRVSPEQDNYDPDNIGVESVLINGDAPTFGSDYHLHLTTGDLEETSIFLGTDDHNVRTTTNGNIQITTPNATNKVWEFDTDGTLTFPSGNLSIGNAFGSDSIVGSTGTIVGVVAQGQYGGVGLQWIENISNIDSTSTQTLVAAVIVNGPLAATTGTVQIVTGFVNTATTATFAEHTWEFGVDGSIVFPTLTVSRGDRTGTLTGQTLLFGDSTQGVIISTPNGTADNNSSQRLVINPGQGATGTSGEGGDIYLYAGRGGDNDGSGGDIKIRGGLGGGVGAGGYIDIESGESSTYGNGGDITITARDGGGIVLRTFNSESNSRDWIFENDGSTTFPGAVVNSTVAKDGPVSTDIDKGEAATVTVSPSNNTNLNVGAVNGVVFDAGFTLDITVAANGDISAVVTASDPNLNVGDSGTLLGGGALGGTEGVDDVVFTVATLTNIILATAIDLTKNINKLTDGVYSLANGVEGQIMYLVRQAGSTYNAITVNVANARIDGVLNTTIDYYPFDGNAISLNMSILIFTDGAWQADSGSWD